jgi:hypothetical protein
LSEEKLYFFNSLPNLYQALKGTDKAQEIEKAVEDMLTRSFGIDLKEKVKRFLEIPRIGPIEAKTEYFRLYSELMQLYVNGLYYPTIVVAGVLCERICYDILLEKKISVEDKPLTEEQIACLFEMFLTPLFILLHKWGLIKKETHDEMFAINQKRNEYVHPKKIHPNTQSDALDMLKRISKILSNELEIKIEPTGTVTLP